MFEYFHPFAISLMIGLLIGIERERSHPKGSQAMGVRTFVLLALLGSLAAWVHEAGLTITISVFALAAILAGYFRSTAKQQTDFGLTTEFSGAVVYVLGYISLRAPLLAAILGGAVLLVLLARKGLHTFSRSLIKTQEIQAAVTILIIALGILPFLPNYTIDPWQLFNPRRYCMLVLVLAAIQFGGYISIRIFGQKLGMMLMGYLGGLVSSTAIYATLPRLVHERPTLLYNAVSAAILATTGTLTEFLLIIAFVSPQLTATLLLPVLTTIIVGILLALIIIRNNGASSIEPQHTNPLDLKSVLRISCYIAGMLILIGVANNYIGAKGVQLLSFLGGSFELHSTALATSVLFAEGKILLNATIFALLLAVTGSFLAKMILLWSLARDRFAAITTGCLLIMYAAGAAVYWLF